jgi:hypothetical protein
LSHPRGQAQLASNNQWSVFLRVSKQIHWGKELPGGSTLEQYTAVQAPLVGSVRGLVSEKSIAGSRPAPNVAVSLDHYRSVVTDAAGHYDFGNVPEGTHQVEIDTEQLSTDYEPGVTAKAVVSVDPKAVARADFNVVRLAMFSGKIVAPAEASIENIIIRLNGTNRYTTPYQDGSFFCYNLPEGDYDVAIDPQTLPEGYLLTSPGSSRVSPRSFSAVPPVGFEIGAKPVAVKPVREILKQEIHIGAPSGAGQASGPGKSGQPGAKKGGILQIAPKGATGRSGGAVRRGGRTAAGKPAGGGGTAAENRSGAHAAATVVPRS